MREKFKNKLTFTRIIALGFFCIILLGAALLMLPISARNGISTPFTDCLFTSTSATCVTGLIVRSTFDHWSVFGQLVILTLIQIGGLGFMTIFTMFAIFVGKRISLKERLILMQSAGTMRMDGLITLIKHILTLTFTVEGIGAFLLSFRFCKDFGVVRGIYYAVFHSISAFCNAGFDLMGNENGPSLTQYAHDPLVNIVIMLLVIIGGIGFLVIEDLRRKKFVFKKLELHSKLVISVTSVLIFGGALIFFITEYNHSMANEPLLARVLEAFFQSVTCRTAGFNTIDQAALSESGYLLSMLLMLIGGSPGSTAGGIKTTTVLVFLLYSLSTARNSNDAVFFKRRLNPRTLKQASAIVGVYLSMVFIATMMITAVDPVKLTDALYEVCSAVGTVGISVGITASLSIFSQIILILLMFAGRIGGMSLILVLAENQHNAPLSRPEEKILIG